MPLKSFDVFISYAAEDRDLVETLYDRLTEAGLRVWYARKELIVGEPVRPVINLGLASSRYGIAIISPSYTSHWSLGELFVLIKEKGRLLPVLHEITIEELATINPEIITFYCPSTAMGIDNLVAEILRTVKPMPSVYYLFAEFMHWLKKYLRVIFTFLIILLAIWVSSFVYGMMKPRDAQIESAIRNRVLSLQKMVGNRLRQNLIMYNGQQTKLYHIRHLEQSHLVFNSAASFKDKIEFSNGWETITNVGGIIHTGLFQMSSQIEAPFNLTDFRPYLLDTPHEGNSGDLSYMIYNMKPLHYKVVASDMKSGIYEIEVEYTDALRYAEVTLEHDAAGNKLSRKIQLFGFKRRETMVFGRKAHNWEVLSIR